MYQNPLKIVIENLSKLGNYKAAVAVREIGLLHMILPKTSKRYSQHNLTLGNTETIVHLQIYFVVLIH